MATNYNASIVRSSLVMYYDMNNTQKSWLGAPATNYIPNPYASYNGSSFVLGYNYQNLGATYTYRTGVDNPVNAPGVLEYYTGTSGYKYFSIDSTSLPSTTTYTFSYYARLVGAPTGGNNAPIDSQLWRANGSDRSVTGDWNPTFTFDWKRYSTSGPAEASTILQYFPVHSGNIIGGYTIQYCGFQIEPGSYATPFVVGTRSNTQAIVDLAGNNTLTATSLTYNSDNTFSFNGTSGYIACGNLGTFYPQGTVSFWMNSAAIASYPNPFATHFQGGNAGFRFEGRSDGNFGMVVGNDAGTYTSHTFISSGMQANTWYNITLTWIVGSNIAVGYLNGVQVFNEAQTYWATTMPSVTIGNGFSASRYWNGKISATQIYNRSLSATEVAQNFNALRGRYGI